MKAAGIFSFVFEAPVFICQMAEQYFLQDSNLHPSYTVRDFSFLQ